MRGEARLRLHLADYIGETTSYDKKLMLERKDPTSWLKSVSAFANTQGGRLIFGVADDGSRDAYIRIGNESVKASAVELKRLDLMERRGSGFGKILDAYNDASEWIGKHVAPSFISDPSGFVVTLPNLHYAASHGAVASFAGAKKRSAKSSAKRGVESSAKSGAKSSAIRRGKAAGKNENIIFRAIRDNSHVSIAELQRKTRLSNGGVRKIISVLKSKGKIVRVGGTHGGYWEILK